MTPEEAFRRRRCAALRIAMLFGVLIPFFDRHWVVYVIVGAGLAVVVFTYWRNCRPGAAVGRDEAGTKPARTETHPRESSG